MKQENQRELEAMIESEYSHIAGLTVQKGGRLFSISRSFNIFSRSFCSWYDKFAMMFNVLLFDTF